MTRRLMPPRHRRPKSEKVGNAVANSVAFLLIYGSIVGLAAVHNDLTGGALAILALPVLLLVFAGFGKLIQRSNTRNHITNRPTADYFGVDARM